MRPGTPSGDTPPDDTPSSPDGTSHESLDDLIVRYWTGETSADEAARLTAWFARHPGRQSWYDDLHRRLRKEKWTTLSPNVVAERTVNIVHAARIQGKQPSTNVTPRRPSSYWRYVLGGTLAGMLLLSVFWQQRVPQRIVHATTPRAGNSIYTTGNGERARVTLPDGSTVQLNVASRLEVPFDYDRGNRTIRLTGEALFTVAHYQGNPFTVITEQSTTRVLGTSFIVRQYATDTAAVVAVHDGKVSVEFNSESVRESMGRSTRSAQHGAVVVTAGYETVLMAGHIPRVDTANARRFSFAQGTLSITSLTLQDAIPELNRWYNADIRLGDSTLATRPASGSLEVGSITDLMWLLHTAYDVRVVRTGRVVTLYPEESAP